MGKNINKREKVNNNRFLSANRMKRGILDISVLIIFFFSFYFYFYFYFFVFNFIFLFFSFVFPFSSAVCVCICVCVSSSCSSPHRHLRMVSLPLDSPCLFPFFESGWRFDLFRFGSATPRARRTDHSVYSGECGAHRPG